MAKYPEYNEVPIRPTVRMRLEFKTIVNKFNEEGVETRKSKWDYPRRHMSVEYGYISKVNAETLWEFFIARKGSFQAFNFFMPEPETTYPSYTGEYVGAGDGSSTVFNLPCRGSTAQTVYVDGVEQADSADYVIGDSDGEDGADSLTFTSAPSDGAIITISFTGTLKVRSRFANDYLDFESFYDRLASVGVELTGLLNDK